MTRGELFFAKYQRGSWFVMNILLVGNQSKVSFEKKMIELGVQYE
jgi:hypothetical protein